MTEPASPSFTRIILLICGAHFASHFYHLLLPPLFPLLHKELNVGFTELGFAITVYSLTTALTQAPVGFLVDRHGARLALIIGVATEAVAYFLIGAFPSYLSILALMVLAGLGNSVFHPADYSILNARIASGRIGRAFSFHTFAGLLGSAIAPALIIALANLVGWRAGIMLCGAAGGVLALVLMLNSKVLDEPSSTHTTHSTGQAVTKKSSVNLLLSAPVLMATAFFVGIAVFGGGITSFGISALGILKPGNLAHVTAAVSAYLFAAPIGVLAGGWIADRITRHDRFAAGCLTVIAACAFTIAAITPHIVIIALVLGIAGLASGAVSPSRDMIVRALAPPGQTGKVFGFVSTGFNIGGILAPPMFGLLLDHGLPRMVFWVVGAMALATVMTVLVTGEKSRRTLVASAGD